jgi:hypothetical protein
MFGLTAPAVMSWLNLNAASSELFSKAWILCIFSVNTRSFDVFSNIVCIIMFASLAIPIIWDKLAKTFLSPITSIPRKLFTKAHPIPVNDFLLNINLTYQWKKTVMLLS